MCILVQAGIQRSVTRPGRYQGSPLFHATKRNTKWNLIEFLFNPTQTFPLMPLMPAEKEIIPASTDVKELLTVVIAWAIRANPNPTVEGSHFPKWT